MPPGMHDETREIGTVISALANKIDMTDAIITLFHQQMNSLLHTVLILIAVNCSVNALAYIYRNAHHGGCRLMQNVYHIGDLTLANIEYPLQQIIQQKTKKFTGK